jgi:hypothetical protein
MENLNLNVNLLIIIFSIIVIFIFSFKKHQKSSSTIILDKIKEINEYASHELNYFENISNEEVLRIFNCNIPFIKKGFSFTMIGKIKIGINMDSIVVNISNNNIDVKIPEIKIISHETKVSEIGFQTKNPFFQININDFNKKLEEKKMLKEVEILQNRIFIEESYEVLKKKITESLLLIPEFKKKIIINYNVETPMLVVDNAKTIESKNNK